MNNLPSSDSPYSGHQLHQDHKHPVGIPSNATFFSERCLDMPLLKSSPLPISFKKFTAQFFLQSYLEQKEIGSNLQLCDHADWTPHTLTPAHIMACSQSFWYSRGINTPYPTPIAKAYGKWGHEGGYRSLWTKKNSDGGT